MKEREKEGIIHLSMLIYLKRFYLQTQAHTHTYYEHTKIIISMLCKYIDK